MFCPRCATEDNQEQQFCRVCGAPLSEVRLALEGRVGEALKKLEGGESRLTRLPVVLIILLLIASAFINLPSGIVPLLFGLFLGSLVSTRIVQTFNERALDDARKLLDPRARPEDQKPLDGARPAGHTLPLAPDAAPTRAKVPAAYSAVEATTLELDEKKNARRPGSG